MKTISIHHFLLLTILIIAGTIVQAPAQDTKFSARVSAQYVKIMNKESSIRLSAKYKGEDGFQPAIGLEFNIYKTISDDSLFLIGKAITNENGEAKFILQEADLNKPSETPVPNYTARIENDSRFEDNETPISFSVANLTAEVLTVDSVHQIKAILTDASGNPMAGQSLTVGLLRMYAPLQIGEESYETDENGTIIVPLEEPMPGINGVLTFEVALNESEEYGTVKAIIDAPVGVPITDHSTFDERTLWSPPSKTPYYLLIFPNLIILGVWVPILILIVNLFRISRAKTDS